MCLPHRYRRQTLQSTTEVATWHFFDFASSNCGEQRGGGGSGGGYGGEVVLVFEERLLESATWDVLVYKDENVCPH